MSQDDDDDGVGYGRPPKSGRFRKGHSGNPGGRKKASPQPHLPQALSTPIRVKVDGKIVKMSPMEAMKIRLVEKALGGDIAAYRELSKLAPPQPPPPSAPTIRAIKRIIVDPYSCDPLLEALGVVKKDGDHYRIEPWVVEAAAQRSDAVSDELRELLKPYLVDSGVPLEARVSPIGV